jgi:hypothetical protein
MPISYPLGLDNNSHNRRGADRDGDRQSRFSSKARQAARKIVRRDDIDAGQIAFREVTIDAAVKPPPVAHDRRPP